MQSLPWTNWVTCVQFKQNTLVSGSRTPSPFSLYGHEAQESADQASLVGSQVVDWDLRMGKPAYVFCRHTEAINKLLLHGPNDEEIISCSSGMFLPLGMMMMI